MLCLHDTYTAVTAIAVVRPSGEHQSHLLATLAEGELPPRSDRSRFFGLALEALVYTTVAVTLTWLWGERALVFSIFLSAGAMVGRFKSLLRENRDMIWSGSDVAKREANVLTATSVLALFTGALTTFFLSPFLMGTDVAARGFAPALSLAGAPSGGISGLLVHNLLVLLSFFVLAFIYRSYGSTLAICWSACVWGLVLTSRIQGAVEQTERPAWLALAVTLGTVLPYLLLEAFAYVTTTMAGIFLSQGVTTYGLRDLRLRKVAGAVLGLALLSVLCLGLAGFLEVTLS